MYFQDTQEVEKQPSLRQLIAGVAKNPITLGVVVSLGILALIHHVTKSDGVDENDRQTVANSSEPLNEPLETVYYEEEEQFDEPFDSTVCEPLTAESITGNSASEAVENDESQYYKEGIEKEIIRRAMSEMGKRSGEARRRKKQLVMQT